jgi:hypothetical protein
LEREADDVPSEGSRFARRYGWGESFAKVARGRPISADMLMDKLPDREAVIKNGLYG